MRWRIKKPNRFDVAAGEDPEVIDNLVTLVIIDLRIRCWLDRRIGTRGWRPKTDAADVEVFLEAIELEEVGESSVRRYFGAETGFPFGDR